MNHSFLLEIALTASAATGFGLGVFVIVLLLNRKDLAESFQDSERQLGNCRDNIRTLRNDLNMITKERDYLEKSLTEARLQLNQINAIINPEEDEDE